MGVRSGLVLPATKSVRLAGTVTRVKGSNISLVREFALLNAEPAAWSRILDQFEGADRDIVEGAISVGWYELALQNRVFHAMETVLSHLGADVITRFARHAAEHDLNKIHRLYLRLQNPSVALEKSGEYWRRFYDAGTWNVTRVGATGATADLSGISEEDPIFCRFLEGYIGRMFQLAGARHVSCRHSRCKCRGDAVCTFEGRWIE